MFKTNYRSQVLSTIKELVFLNCYDENLVGIWLSGFSNPDNELELLCFKNKLDKKDNNSFCIGDTYIKCVDVDVNDYKSYINKMLDGTIIYDRESTLCKLFVDLALNPEYWPDGKNSNIDGELVCDLATSISENISRPKNEFEKYNSLYKIYSAILECKKELGEEDYELFSTSMNFYNKMFMSKEEAELHNTVLNDVLNDLKLTKELTLKK